MHKRQPFPDLATQRELDAEPPTRGNIRAGLALALLAIVLFIAF